MAAFYSRVFGWQTNQLGPEMGSYTVVTTTDSDENGPKRPGAINGGFYMRTSAAPEQSPSVVIAVEDVDAAIAAIEAAGGKVAGPPQEIPGIGLYASFHDSEGNRLSMLQAAPRGDGS